MANEEVIKTTEELFGKPKQPALPTWTTPPAQTTPIVKTTEELFGEPLKVEKPLRPIVEPRVEPREIDVLPQATGAFFQGLLDEAGMGLPSDVGVLPPPPKLGTKIDWIQDLASGAGRFTGFVVGAPMKLGQFGIRLLLKPAKKPLTKLAGKYGGRLTTKFLQSAGGLGLASAISDISDIKGMPERFKSGSIFGGIFGVTNWANFRKAAPFINQIIRQGSSRAMANIFGMYSTDAWQKLASGQVDPQLAQQAFDELLFSWFSRKPYKAEEVFSDLRRIGDEARKANLPVKIWEAYDTPQGRAAMEKVPARFVVTGNGEVIPTKLFSYMPDVTKLMKAVPELELPPEYRKQLPEPKAAPLAPVERRPGVIVKPELKIPEKITKPPRAPQPLETKVRGYIKGKSIQELRDLRKGKSLGEVKIINRIIREQLRTRIKEVRKGKMVTPYEKAKELEAMRKAELEEIAKFPAEKLPTKERKPGQEGLDFEKAEAEGIDEYYAGLHIPNVLKEWDRHLEKKYGLVTPESVGKTYVNNQIKNVVAKERKERKPIPGLRVLSNLRRLGKPGNKLADMSLEYTKNQSQQTQGDLYKLKTAYNLLGKDISMAKRVLGPVKSSKKIASRIFDLMERKVEPANDYEKSALKIMDSIVKEKGDRAKELDMKIQTMFGEKDWQEIKDYAPIEYQDLRKFLEADQFKHMRDRYIEEIAKKNWPDLYKSTEFKDKAIENARTYFEEFRNDLKTRPFGHLERQRLLDEEILEKLRVEWEKRYPKAEFPLERKRTLDVLVRYVVGANARLEWIKQFGKDVASGKGWYIPEKLNEIRYDFEKGRSERWAMDFFKKYLRQTSALDTRMTRLIRTIRTVQLTKLAFAFIPNSLQWFTNTVPQISTRSAVEALWDSAKYYGVAGKKAKAKQREFFSKTGASTLKQAVQLAMMESPAKVSGLADIMLKAHLFTGTEFFNALYSASAGARKTIHLSEKLYKGRGKSWRSPFYRQELKKMGLSDADIERIIKDGPLTSENVKELADASFHMRRYTQFLADAFHLPKSWGSPAGRLITQFKNFAYNQSGMLWNEPVRGAYEFAKSGGRKGDITKLMKAMIALPLAGAAVTHFKKWLYPKMGIHFYEELMAGKSWPFKMIVYMLNTGNLGLAADVIMSFEFGKAGLVSLMGGPTISDISQFAQALSSTTKEVITSIENKNPKWIAHRAKTIQSYWLKFGERLSPDMRLPIQNFFKSYKDAKSAANWTQLVQRAYKKYKQIYKLQSPAKAEEFWRAFIETQGKEYREIFEKTPKKPTPKEIEKWWEEQAVSPAERMKMSGTKRARDDFWY